MHGEGRHAWHIVNQALLCALYSLVSFFFPNRVRETRCRSSCLTCLDRDEEYIRGERFSRYRVTKCIAAKMPCRADVITPPNPPQLIIWISLFPFLWMLYCLTKDLLASSLYFFCSFFFFFASITCICSGHLLFSSLSHICIQNCFNRSMSTIKLYVILLLMCTSLWSVKFYLYSFGSSTPLQWEQPMPMSCARRLQSYWWRTSMKNEGF